MTTSEDLFEDIFSPIIKQAQQEARRIRRKRLKEIITNKDNAGIWSYCYYKAINEKVVEQMTDLALYGRAQCEITESEAVRVMVLTTRWSQRFIRWFNLPIEKLPTSSQT